MRQPTATKLFIGQVPKDYGEADLRALFEPYGDIHDLHILQDKATPGQHRGCAFLTYFDNESAKTAQLELHEQQTLPGMKHKMQVKPAASETSEESRKLFVGMISRSTDESDLKEMFAAFGTIESISILKDKMKGESKGCAFIRYETRLQAQNAIKQMHHSKTMEGCRGPIVVKLADNDKDKMERKGLQGIQGLGVGGGGGIGANAGVGAGAGPAPGGVHPLANNTAVLAAQVAYYQQMFAQMGFPQVIANAPGASQTTSRTTAGLPAAYGLNVPGLPQSNTANQQQKEGPEDANIFIYQIPTEFNDSDLMQTFGSFGNILSAKVFIDRKTGFSKGFGFVSYDNASSASAAIASMNGFAVGSKRLKVQLKRKRDQAKPY